MTDHFSFTVAFPTPAVWVVATLLVIVALSLLIFWASTPWKIKARSDAPWPMRLFMAFLIVLTPIWGLLIAATVVSLWNALLHSAPPQIPRGRQMERCHHRRPNDRPHRPRLRPPRPDPRLHHRTPNPHGGTRPHHRPHLKGSRATGRGKTVKISGKDKDGNDKTIEETKPNIEVRIGGLLSLERISQDPVKYDKGRDHVRVMEVICAYVRENAKATDAQAAPPEPEVTKDTAPKDQNKLWQDYAKTLKQWAATLTAPREDIATALNIIGRREPGQLRAEARWGKDARPDAEWPFAVPAPAYPVGKNDATPSKPKVDTFEKDLVAWQETLTTYPGYRPYLRGTNLQKADLSDMTLKGIHLDGAQLQGADLFGVQLQGADLGKAQLQGANLGGAQLQGASLIEAQLQRAILRLAQLQGAILRLAHLQGATLMGAHLQGANLGDAHLQGAYLGEAQLQAAYLMGAQLQGAYLGKAQLQGADLRWAQFSNTTTLTAVNASQAAVNAVDLSMLTLSTDQINSMFGDASVILPNGITPQSPDWPAHWPKHELDYFDFRDQWKLWKSNPSTYTPPTA